MGSPKGPLLLGRLADDARRDVGTGWPPTAWVSVTWSRIDRRTAPGVTGMMSRLDVLATNGERTVSTSRWTQNGALMGNGSVSSMKISTWVFTMASTPSLPLMMAVGSVQATKSWRFWTPRPSSSVSAGPTVLRASRDRGTRARTGFVAPEALVTTPWLTPEVWSNRCAIRKNAAPPPTL